MKPTQKKKKPTLLSAGMLVSVASARLENTKGVPVLSSAEPKGNQEHLL